MAKDATLQMLKNFHQRGYSLIPLRPRDKIPIVKWKEYQLNLSNLMSFTSMQANWAIRCDDRFHALDFDDPETYEQFMKDYGEYFAGAPIVKSGRGYHLWFKPKKPVSSFTRNGIEVKGIGSLIVVPPSIHPGGKPYRFLRPLNGKLPEVDIEHIVKGPTVTRPNQNGKNENNNESNPSEFAVRYGKSPYPQSFCGRATKIFTRDDGRVKHMISLRCWKWHCPQCAILLKRFWIKKLENISFKFIIVLPTTEKPATLLRRLNKPRYVHILSSGKSWLFLTDGEYEQVHGEVEKAGYILLGGQKNESPSHQELSACLNQALCQEQAPLHTRRKITHSRSLFPCDKSKTGIQEKDTDNESIQNPEFTEEEGEKMEDKTIKPDLQEWENHIVMKPIREVAKELESEGWSITWPSDVEAIASKVEAGKSPPIQEQTDILKLTEELGIELHQAGNEYVALCPFHEDHNPSLAINAEKGVWHCFGCGRGGNARTFLNEWRRLHGG